MYHLFQLKLDYFLEPSFEVEFKSAFFWTKKKSLLLRNDPLLPSSSFQYSQNQQSSVSKLVLKILQEHSGSATNFQKYTLRPQRAHSLL